MNLLAIETSSELASIALLHKDTIFCKNQKASRTHAQQIMPMIQTLLAEADLTISALDGIVYGRGPGSFTGLRISCSIAKGLGYSQDLALYPVSTLAAVAYEARQLSEKDLPVLALLDARMNQLYWAYFSPSSYQSVEQVSAASAIRLETKEPFLVAGINYETYLSELSPTLKETMAQQLVVPPQAEAMIALVLNTDIQPVTASEALPVYVRNQITQGDARG